MTKQEKINVKKNKIPNQSTWDQNTKTKTKQRKIKWKTARKRGSEKKKLKF